VSIEARIERAASLIRDSQHAIAFTGAGHSTASGIPDFRSPGSGLWEQANPMLVASIWAFRLKPNSFYDWIRPMLPNLLDAKPNPGHMALAELERMGKIKAVITQNIDNLHQKAGSQRVLELHGHLREATCVRCYGERPINAALVELVREGGVPRCECGGPLKPNVILFGEQLPVKVLNEAMAEARHCDLVLVAGSSLEVTPAADIPFLAVDTGARGIMVNLVSTGFDPKADVVIHDDLTQILPQIVHAI
jgi:NAD-dependent deacetylase